MTSWTDGNFSIPYLAGNVEISDQAGEVELCNGKDKITLAIEGDVEAAIDLFTSLTQPGSNAWTQLRDQSNPELAKLVTDFDRFGWLREGDPSGHKRLNLRVSRLDSIVNRAHEWLDLSEWVFGMKLGNNLAALALIVCRKTWSRSSPITEKILRELFDDPTSCNKNWDPVAIVMCDPADIEKQVWTALQLMVMSRCDGLEPSYTKFLPSSLEDGPGINVLVVAEKCAVELLTNLGESGLHQLIRKPDGALRAAPIIFQHRWFETIRYVDSVASLLSFRFGKNLRTLVVKYLSEEMGHEVHELEMCHELGISNHELEKFSPLAFFAAYPEMLSELADRRPLSFLLSMTIAEGLPGSGRKLTEQLGDHGINTSVITTHDDIDQDLNHEMVTRTIFSELDWVSAPAGIEAISDFLRIIETTHLGWEMLSRYAKAGFPHTPQPFSVTPNDICKLCTITSPLS